MKCPVCPIDPVPEGATVCPGCGTDVSPLRRIEELGAALYCEAVKLAKDDATDEAIARASGVLALDGRNAKARKLLGKLLWGKGQIREAAQQWERAAALTPDDEQLRNLVSAARRRLHCALSRFAPALRRRCWSWRFLRHSCSAGLWRRSSKL